MVWWNVSPGASIMIMKIGLKFNPWSFEEYWSRPENLEHDLILVAEIQQQFTGLLTQIATYAFVCCLHSFTLFSNRRQFFLMQRSSYRGIIPTPQN